MLILEIRGSSSSNLGAISMEAEVILLVHMLYSLCDHANLYIYIICDHETLLNMSKGK